MRSFFVAVAASAVSANLLELDEQELGTAIFDKIASVVAPSENFSRFETELGQPAMHDDLLDGKLQTPCHVAIRAPSSIISDQHAH